MTLTHPAVAYVLGLALGLAACSSSGSSSGTAVPSPSTASAIPSASAPAATKKAASPSASGPQVGRIGSAQGVTLPTGVVVSIPKVAMHSIPKAAGSGAGTLRPGDTEAVLTVVVENGSAQSIDAALLAVDVTASGEQADGLNYSEVPTNPIGGTILPGSTVSGTYGFVIRKTDVGKLQAEVWAGQSEPHAIFTDGGGRA